MILGLLLSTVILGAIGVVAWLSQRGMPPGPYIEDSICTYREQAWSKPRVALLSALDSGNSNHSPALGSPSSSKAGEAQVKAQQETDEEIAGLVRGMVAANAAEGRIGADRRLFCDDNTILTAVKYPQRPFVDAYFADVDRRIKMDGAKLCATTKMVDDLLQYLVRRYPCPRTP